METIIQFAKIVIKLFQVNPHGIALLSQVSCPAKSITDLLIRRLWFCRRLSRADANGSFSSFSLLLNIGFHWISYTAIECGSMHAPILCCTC